LDDRAWTQVVALTGHDLIQNVPQQTVNIVREDTRSDNSLTFLAWNLQVYCLDVSFFWMADDSF
jgi:hypothetical protein